ncbi:MAG: hypothetical protein AAF447_04315 [Myxococcota bacterium]
MLAVAWGACGGDSDGTVDLGRPDAGGDGPVADLARDLAADGVEEPDLPTMRDAGPMLSPTCFDERNVFDHCLCEGIETCMPGECGDAAVCLPDLCGRMTCQGAGAGCLTDGDCGAGSTCTPSSLGFSVCQSPAGCGDARDCPLGFACEAGACVDRRRPCAALDGCPAGFLCEANEALGAFCRRAYRLCANRGVCPSQSECADVVGEGEFICRRSGGDCDGTLDCDEDEVCGTDPRSERAVCGPSGPCSSTEGCPAGSECLDLYGDGIGECAVVGACRSAADCAPLELCGAPATGGPTACR